MQFAVLWIAAVAATPCRAFSPPSTSGAFGLPTRRQLLASKTINSKNNRIRIAPSMGSNTLEDDRAPRNNSSYEPMQESCGGMDTEEQHIISSETHRGEEHETCIIDDVDDDDDDEIDELFTSLLHKVGRYSPEVVTISYKDDDDDINNHTQPISMLHQAFNIAREAHKDQCRKSGEPYITHPLGVAHIIADMELDLTSLLTAILHDTVEDTNMTLIDIENMFGEEISQCVDGVTKIAKIAFTSYEEQQSENYRKLILAMSKDIVS